MYEPQTRVQQGVPSAQIGPQIDTLFTSWREFENYKDPYPQPISIIERHYKNQLDNGFFGLLIGQMTFFSNYTKETEQWAQYKSITFSFTFVTTGMFDRFYFMIPFWHFDAKQWQWTSIASEGHISLGPNDSSLVSYTFYLDSIHPPYTYRDLNCIEIGYYNYWGPMSETNCKYSSYVSELLVTAERRSQEVSGNGE